MGMGRKKDREKQQDFWVPSSEIVTTPGHVFYERLNTVLNAEKFDQRIEAICRKYYKSSSGRPVDDAGNVLPDAVCWVTSRASILNAASRGAQPTASATASFWAMI
jgi:hypothetical protein